jgi:translocator protein
MKVKKIVRLILSILLCQAAGAVGSLFTFPAISAWYVHLYRPSFSPPAWLFGPVWLVLYTLMGISFFLIWQKRTKKNPQSFPIAMFLVHLAVNSLWSVIFFGLKSPYLALIIIGVLWLLIFVIIKTFRKINKWASILLYPYLAWVSFASLLNLFIWLLN